MYRLTKNYKLRNLHIPNLWITVFSKNGEHITGLRFYEKKPKGKKGKSCQVCKEAAKQIEEWFSGKRKNFNLPLQLESQETGRKALQKIPYGTTVSFEKFAKMVGFRGAMPVIPIVAENPIPLIYPCHRIVRKGDILGNYIGFNEYKDSGDPRNLLLKLALIHHEEKNKGIIACIRSLLCKIFC